MDLTSILKASIAISSEIELARLLENLIRIAVENAGAQQGYLIINTDSGLYIEAEYSTDATKETVLLSRPVRENRSIPESIIKFVAATLENVVIDDASKHPTYSSDPVIMEKKTRSVLCTPIILQKKLIGILYFENDLIPNAFTKERIQLLMLLSGQMAVSLQNSINEEKKKKLLEENNLQKQELLKTRLEIQEQTLNNISNEIHDNVGQILTLVKLNINTISSDLPEADKEKLAQSKQLIEKVITDLRTLSKTLNIDRIKEIGLFRAIEDQLESLKKTGLYTTTVTQEGDPWNYESGRDQVVYRVLQELITNIIKHAKATKITVSLMYTADTLLISIEDNGAGFDIDKISLSTNTGLGLRNIKNRIALLKGNIYFTSNPGFKTEVSMQIPRAYGTIHL